MSRVLAALLLVTSVARAVPLTPPALGRLRPQAENLAGFANHAFLIARDLQPRFPNQPLTSTLGPLAEQSFQLAELAAQQTVQYEDVASRVYRLAVDTARALEFLEGIRAPEVLSLLIQRTRAMVSFLEFIRLRILPFSAAAPSPQELRFRVLWRED